MKKTATEDIEDREACVGLQVFGGDDWLSFELIGQLIQRQLLLHKIHLPLLLPSRIQNLTISLYLRCAEYKEHQSARPELL